MTVEAGPQSHLLKSDLLTGFRERETFHSLHQAFALIRPNGLRRASITKLNTGRTVDSSGSHETLTVVRTLDGGLTQTFFLTLEDKFDEKLSLTGAFKQTKGDVEEVNNSDKQKVLMALRHLATSGLFGQILFPEQFAEWTKSINDKIANIFKDEETPKEVKVTPPGK